MCLADCIHLYSKCRPVIAVLLLGCCREVLENIVARKNSEKNVGFVLVSQRRVLRSLWLCSCGGVLVSLWCCGRVLEFLWCGVVFVV